MPVKLEAYKYGASWCARGMGEGVFTHGKTFEELLDNVREALALHFQENLDNGEEIQVLVLTEANVKSMFDLSKAKDPAETVPHEETQRRKALVQHVLKLREGLGPLDMTTAELVRLSREERSRFYES